MNIRSGEARSRKDSVQREFRMSKINGLKRAKMNSKSMRIKYKDRTE